MLRLLAGGTISPAQVGSTPGLKEKNAAERARTMGLLTNFGWGARPSEKRPRCDGNHEPHPPVQGRHEPLHEFSER